MYIFSLPLSFSLKRTPFITPWRTTLKTIIMTVGEYEVDSLLQQNSEMHVSDDDVQFPVVTFSLLIVFVILMPILFLNLLVCSCSINSPLTHCILYI